MMQAIEFETQIQDGVIKTPPNLQSTNGPVKVIVLFEEQQQGNKTDGDVDFLDQIKLQTKGFKLNREEANAR